MIIAIVKLYSRIVVNFVSIKIFVIIFSVYCVFLTRRFQLTLDIDLVWSFSALNFLVLVLASVGSKSPALFAVKALRVPNCNVESNYFLNW